MRNRAFFLIASLGAYGCAAGPQPDITAETAAVRARSEGVAAAEAAKDFDAAIAFWAEDAVVQPAGAPQVQGRNAILALYQQYFEGDMLKEFSGQTTHTEVAASADLAFEYGVNRMVLAGPESDLLDVGKYLAVWKKINGEWYVVALSFTSDKPAPEPIPSR